MDAVQDTITRDGSRYKAELIEFFNKRPTKSSFSRLSFFVRSIKLLDEVFYLLKEGCGNRKLMIIFVALGAGGSGAIYWKRTKLSFY